MKTANTLCGKWKIQKELVLYWTDEKFYVFVSTTDTQSKSWSNTAQTVKELACLSLTFCGYMGNIGCKFPRCPPPPSSVLLMLMCGFYINPTLFFLLYIEYISHWSLYVKRFWFNISSFKLKLIVMLHHGQELCTGMALKPV